MEILDDPTILCCCPIAHLTSWDPLATTYTNSSSRVAGGYLYSLCFWWHLKWPCYIQARAAKAKKTPSASTHSNMKKRFSTMWLPWQIFSSNHANRTHIPPPYSSLTILPPKHGSSREPKTHQKGEPVAACSDAICHKINNPVGINTNRVSTTYVIAHCISHFPNQDNPLPHFLFLQRNFLSCSATIASKQVPS